MRRGEGPEGVTETGRGVVARWHYRDRKWCNDQRRLLREGEGLQR